MSRFGCWMMSNRRRISSRSPDLPVRPPAPNHTTQYEIDTDHYELADGTDYLEVPLRWRSEEEVSNLSAPTVLRGIPTVIDVRVDITNRGVESWSGALYGQFQRGEPESPGGLFRTYTYTGGILSGPEKPYEKVDFSDLESQDVDRTVTGGWGWR